MSDTFTLEPLYNRIIVKRIEAEERTASGLYIPETNREKPTQGDVIAVGPGTLKDDGTFTPLSLQVGDVVLFGKYNGSDICVDGVDYIVMREDEVFCRHRRS